MKSLLTTYLRLTLTSTLILPNIGLNFISNFTHDPSLQIQLSDGVIQGRLKHSVDVGMPYYSYEGIPYAKPPVGELRFRPPRVADKWSGVLNANGDVPSCIQIPSSSWDWYESEDCLYINVYTPEKPSNKSSQNRAVMVWIYGGGFLFGVANSTYYGPDHLLTENVVLVHFNYRVNVFGFMSTGDLESPGNYGLKDQLLALKWVKNNIANFGGDPNKITIFGESAGGASVQYHLVSPKSLNLFERAISESGSTLCAWALQTNPAKIAFQLSRATGFVPETTKDLVNYLRNLPTNKLKTAAISVTLLNSINIAKSLPFSPTIEPEHDDAFLSKKSYEILEKGEFQKVPYILGFNSQESAIAQSALEMGERLITFLPKKEILIPPGLKIRDQAIVSERIKNFYFDTEKSPTIEQYLNFISDSYFYRPIIKSGRLFSAYSTVYMYKFSYEGYYLGRKAFAMNQQKQVKGVMHAEEVWYIFARSDLNRANDTDKLVRNRMVKLWTNFAKFGNPTPEQEVLLNNTIWPEFKTTSNCSYLDIDSTLEIGANYKKEMLEFWETLFDEYGAPPFDTY